MSEHDVLTLLIGANIGLAAALLIVVIAVTVGIAVAVREGWL